MDINQSSFSRSKLNKPGIARSSEENKAISESHKAKESPASQSVINAKQLELKEGQLVKGRVIDHRYNEVKIQLEPGKQIVTAKITGDIPLTIGQEAEFLVTEGGLERLVLKFLPDNTSPYEATIQKALIASGLVMNDRNRAIASELLNHTMPVDKQTLLSLIRSSHANKEASPLTLVLMYKNNIPMTQANVRQFEAYQNGTGQLLNDIRHITKGLSELVKTPLLQDEIIVQEDMQQEGSRAIPPTDKLLMSYSLSSEVSDHRSDALTSVLQINDKLLTILLGDETLHAEVSVNASRDLSSVTDQLKQATMSDESSPNLAKVPLSEMQMETNVPQNSSVQDLYVSLAELLRSAPTLSRFADPIEAGTLQPKDIMSLLKHNLLQMEETGAQRLIISPEYQTLLERAFHDKWTIKPEQLSDKSAIHELYRDLKEDMEKISALSELEGLAKKETNLQEPVKNLQENLRFMSDLNEMFTYLPLPLQLNNQDVHGDLYVFSRKRAMQSKENLSVLLHLDMANLGPMNIHIHMDHNVVQAKFFIEDRDAYRLITEYMSSLTEALTKKGYSLHSEVNQSYKKVDFSKDFIEDNVTEGDVKRYTFDIRT